MVETGRGTSFPGAAEHTDNLVAGDGRRPHVAAAALPRGSPRGAGLVRPGDVRARGGAGRGGRPGSFGGIDSRRPSYCTAELRGVPQKSNGFGGARWGRASGVGVGGADIWWVRRWGMWLE